MTKMQHIIFALFVLALSSTSFQLGWSMRGDKIYGDMFRVTAVAVETLPAMKGR